MAALISLLIGVGVTIDDGAIAVKAEWRSIACKPRPSRQLFTPVVTHHRYGRLQASRIIVRDSLDVRTRHSRIPGDFKPLDTTFSSGEALGSSGIALARKGHSLKRRFAVHSVRTAFRKTRWLMAASIVAVAIPAQASVIFTLGNSGGFSTINLDQSSGPSTTVTGTVNPVPQGNPTVSFSSSEVLDVPSGGQARIEADTGLINDLMISIPGQTFEGFILNPFQPATGGDLVVSVQTNDGVFVYDTPTYGSINGNNFLTITTDALESILSITLTSAGGFADLRQPRILVSDGGGFPPAEIPEPGLLMLLGLSLGAAALARRRSVRS
jgi:hypothetical protein